MSELEDFFRVDSSAPSLSGAPGTENWDFDDFSFDDALLEVGPTAGPAAAPGKTSQAITRPGKESGSLNKEKNASESPLKRASGGGESIRPFDLVSTPSVEDVKAVRPDVKPQDLGLPDIDTAEVDGWDDDSDIFNELEGSQQFYTATNGSSLQPQIPSGSQHAGIGYEKGFRDTPHSPGGDMLDQDDLSFFDRTPSDDLVPSMSSTNAAREKNQQVPVTGASCIPSEEVQCKDMDPRLAYGTSSGQDKSSYGNACTWHTSTPQASNQAGALGGDSSTSWFDSDNIFLMEEDPGHVRDAATPELTLDTSLDDADANSPFLDTGEPKLLQLGKCSAELDQAQVSSYPRHSHDIHNGADLFWNNSETTVDGASNIGGHLQPTNQDFSSGSPELGMNYEAFVSQDAIAFGRSQSTDPPHGQEADYASGQWASSHLSQISMPGQTPEAMQGNSSLFFQPTTPSLSTDGTKVNSVANAMESPVRDGQGASWQYDHSSTNGTNQIISQLSEVHQFTSTSGLPDFAARGAAESDHVSPYNPDTSSPTPLSDVNQATEQSAAEFWNQGSMVEDMHGPTAQSVGFNPPVVPHGIDRSDDMAFFDQLDVVGGAQPVISAGGSIAFKPNEDVAASEHRQSPLTPATAQHRGMEEPVAVGTNGFFQPQAGFGAKNCALDEQNPPAYFDAQYKKHQASGSALQSFPQNGVSVSPAPKPVEVVDDVSFFDTLGVDDDKGTATTGHPAMDKNLIQSSSADVAAHSDTLHSANLFYEEPTSLSNAQIDEFPCRSSTNSATPSPDWANSVRPAQQNGFQRPRLHSQKPGMTDHSNSNGRVNGETFGGGNSGYGAQSPSLYTNGATQPTNSTPFEPYGVANEYSGQAAWFPQQDTSSFNGLGTHSTPYQMPSQTMQPSFLYDSQQQWETSGASQHYMQPGSYSAQVSPTVPVAYETATADQTTAGSWPRHQHGRPACPLISFGVGGKVALMIPKVGAMGASVGQIELQTVRNLPSILSHRQREAGYGMPPSALDPARAAIERFPGPLGASSTREKLISFITERMELCTEEEPECQDPDGLRALWGTLRVMVKHQGFLVDKKTKPNPVANQEFLDLMSASDTSEKSWVGGGGNVTIIQESGNQPHMQTTAAEVQKLASLGNISEAITAAKSSELWDIALVLSQSLGPKAFSETASEMASQKLAHGAPLQTLLHMMSGNAEAAVKGVSQEVSSTEGAGHQFGASAPGYTMMTPAAEPLLDDWRGNLAMLAANRTAASMEIASKLGDRLLKERNDVLGAHMCYLVGGCTPQSADATSGCRFSLIGWNHTDGSFPSAVAIQRTEIFEWVFGAVNPSSRIVPFQPYKLHYAWMLAEYGKVSEAVHYCELVLEALKSLGNKMPKGLTVCAGSARALLDRLQQHAAAYNLTLKRSATLFESFGRILDKGINRLIGVGEGQGAEEGTSRSQSEGWAPSDAVSAYKTTSQASFDSMKNTAEEGRQRLSPRPPIAPPSPAAHSHYYNQAMSARWPANSASSPAPSDPYLTSSASAPGLASTYDEATRYPQHSYSPLSPARQQQSQHTTTESKGGWLSMLWGGKGKTKNEKGVQEAYSEQVTNVDENNTYLDKGLNNWGLQGDHQVQSQPNSYQVSTTPVGWTNAQPGALGSGPFSFSQNSLNSQRVDNLEGGVGASPTPGTVPGIFQNQSSTPPPSNFFVPAAPIAHSSPVAEFEDVPLE